jgi:hypothetical protein
MTAFLLKGGLEDVSLLPASSLQCLLMLTPPILRLPVIRASHSLKAYVA